MKRRRGVIIGVRQNDVKSNRGAHDDKSAS